MPLVQESKYLVRLTVDPATSDVWGVPDSWDSFEGGEVASESTNYRPGGVREAEVMISPSTTSDITISRGYRSERDAAVEKLLIGRLGHPAPSTATCSTPASTRSPAPASATRA